MNDFKSLVTSKTFWGAVVAIGSAGLSLGHYTLTPVDAAQASELIAGIASGVGGLVAIVGRVLASKRIGSALPSA